MRPFNSPSWAMPPSMRLALSISASLLLLRSVQAQETQCRYNATSPPAVSYYTCTEMAEKYGISLEHFMLLNPLIDVDCSSLEANATYCVDGVVLQTSPDGSCGPSTSYTCKGYAGGNCCNSATWTCGSTLADCEGGTCYEGLCEGFPSEYTLDGSCGPNTGYKKCGKWGTCCNLDGVCGSGPAFCGVNCESGECESPGDQEEIPIFNPTPDGTCGGENGYSCLESEFGNCCSFNGQCGNSTEHCTVGCQRDFGTCAANSTDISPDGSCGGTDGYTCEGSTFGTCCSANGFCGNTTDHCDVALGCQDEFGSCTRSDVSVDGTCGGTNGFTCVGSTFGDCCSATGFCGSTSDHCEAGCQTEFGTCTNSDISPDGTCGGPNGYKCAGSAFGDCCSATGYCGSTSDHCGGGCQTQFGTCTNSDLSPDGTCGGTNGYKCTNSGFGNCCSANGYCGSTGDHCDAGCQSAFGTCTGSNLSPDGTCGGANGYKCTNSGFGNCCSAGGWCGSTTDHCGAGCQSSFGTCGPADVSTNGECGSRNGKKCQGSGFGNCCSQTGYCGSAVEHCAQGCQSAFSSSCMTGTVPSLDGTCGSARSLTCAGGPFNNQCCGSTGYCGTTSAHCGTGCQQGYGRCN